jgi:NADH-quinone oxidoreductase subunit J
MPIDGSLCILGGIVLVGAVAAITLRNLVHCALCLMLAFVGLAGLFLHLGALFAGLVQILVYVGAVGVLLVFAILLTQGGGRESKPYFSSPWYVGVGIAALLASAMVAGVVMSPTLTSVSRQATEVTVKDLGHRMMSDYILPLEVMALLLTATAIGAIVLAMPDKREIADQD